MDQCEIIENGETVSNRKMPAPQVGRCPYCGEKCLPEQLVCTKCGKRTLEFGDAAKKLGITEQLNQKLLPLEHIISDAGKPDANWLYPELYPQMLKMRQILRITQACPTKNTRINKRIESLAKKFLNQSQSRLMEIALVGTVKAGKSSLINAFIGVDLASVDAVPETSVLTKYRTTASGYYLKIRFYTAEDWKRIWSTSKEAATFRNDYAATGAENIRNQYLGKRVCAVKCDTLEQLRNEVMKWTKSSSPEHFFVKELEVGYQSDVFPHDVFLVDTPGLDDPVKYRSDITRRYISKADWTMACIKSGSLSEKAELSFLSKVISNNNYKADQVFTVVTKKDQQNQEDLDRMMDLFLRQIGQIYGNEELARSHTFAVSSVGHVLLTRYLRGEKLDRKARFELQGILTRLYCMLDDIEDQKDEIMSYMGIQALYDYLNERAMQQARGVIVKRIRQDYVKCCQAIHALTKTQQEIGSEYMRDLIASEEELEKQIQETRDARDQLREKKQQAASLSYELGRALAAAQSKV